MYLYKLEQQTYGVQKVLNSKVDNVVICPKDTKRRRDELHLEGTKVINKRITGEYAGHQDEVSKNKKKEKTDYVNRVFRTDIQVFKKEDELNQITTS